MGTSSDILLINPPFSRLMGVRYSAYFPLNLGYLAAALRGSANVKIYNVEDPLPGDRRTESPVDTVGTYGYGELFSHSNRYQTMLEADSAPVWAEIRDVFFTYRPKMIGITCMSAKFPSAVKVAKIYKECCPAGVVVFGGQHPTLRGSEVFASGAVDFIVRGEGEQTIRELVNIVLTGRSTSNRLSAIDGISFLDGKVVMTTKDREAVGDLDTLQMPARDLLLKPMGDASQYGAILTTRGCPFKCGFCSAWQIVGKKVRYHSVERVVSEIRDVIDRYHTRQFTFWDDTFTVNRDRTIELLRAIRRCNIEWSCTSRVDRVDYPLLKEMKKAGCWGIDFGIESGSERMLPLIGKDIHLSQAEKAARDCERAGIVPNCFLMTGFPDETEQDIRETIAFASSTRFVELCLSVFTPYPGTQLYERARALGMAPDAIDWAKMSHQSSDRIFTQCIARDRFNDILLELIAAIDKHNNPFSQRMARLKIFARANPLFLARKLARRLLMLMPMRKGPHVE